MAAGFIVDIDGHPANDRFAALYQGKRPGKLHVTGIHSMENNIGLIEYVAIVDAKNGFVWLQWIDVTDDQVFCSGKVDQLRSVAEQF